MGYQFIHIEMYSRAGREGRGVDWVLNEAARMPGSCLHVASPKPAEVVFGADVEAVRSRHAVLASAATTTTRSGHTRAIRRDQNTMLAVVASHPALTSDLRPETRRAVLEWEAHTVAWLQEQFGDALVSVVRHSDEKHPHVHAFVLPTDPEMRAAFLHPGSSAKASSLARVVPGEDSKLANKRGDLAYRQAMRSWQNSYWAAVSKPSGLARLGPGRRRLSRAGWQAEQSVQASANIAAAEAAATASDIDRRLRAADEALEAAERQAQSTIAQAKRVAASAHAEAGAIVSKAAVEAVRVQAEIRRLAGFTSRLRALWDGLRVSTLREQIQRQFQSANAGRVEALKEARDRAEQAVREEKRQRHEAETTLDRLQVVFQEICRERDRLRLVVNHLRERRQEPCNTLRPKL